MKLSIKAIRKLKIASDEVLIITVDKMVSQIEAQHIVDAFSKFDIKVIVDFDTVKKMKVVKLAKKK